jgi:deoxyribonuclease-4
LEPFGILLDHPLLAGVPLIVETPGGKDGHWHADDIALLKKLPDA